jgi:hypothetical protein
LNSEFEEWKGRLGTSGLTASERSELSSKVSEKRDIVDAYSRFLSVIEDLEGSQLSFHPLKKKKKALNKQRKEPKKGRPNFSLLCVG